MIETKEINKVYSKKTPSVFCVASPLQALCAIEAIRDYEIDDYKIYVIIMPTETRKEQITNILSAAGYVFKTVTINCFFYFRIPYIIASIRRKYERAFVGNIYSSELSIVAVSNLKKEGAIVYLDDGTATLSFLYDYKMHFKMTFRAKRIILKFIAHIRRIVIDKYLYTLYCDIENNKYVIRKNSFQHIVSSFEKKSKETDIALFLGTNPPAYCEYMKISLKTYYNCLDNIMKLFCDKYEGCHIVYIPHGRDDSPQTKSLCKKYNADYRKLNVCIEYYLLESGITPISLAGFGSSALYNLKMMYPKLDVTNVMLKNRECSFTKFDVVTNYYEKHGIKTLCYNWDELCAY